MDSENFAIFRISIQHYRLICSSGFPTPLKGDLQMGEYLDPHQPASLRADDLRLVCSVRKLLSDSNLGFSCDAKSNEPLFG